MRNGLFFRSSSLAKAGPPAIVTPNTHTDDRLNESNEDSRKAIMSIKILRLPAVKGECGLSRSSIYLRIAQGLWPKPVSLGGRAVGWPDNEVKAVNAARIAGKTDDEIRELVAELQKSRKTRS